MNKKLIFVLIALSLVLMAGCGRKKAVTVKEAPLVPVKVTSVTQGDLQEIFNTTGTVEATNKANITSKVSGRVARVSIQLGDYVSKGQSLVVLEKTDFINQLNQAKATLAQAETNFAQSKATYNRMQRLFAEHIISHQEYDSAKTQFDIAENQVSQARISVAISEEQMRNAEIRAPISGYIGGRQINPGEMVSPGVSLMDIVNLSQVYVSVNLSDSYIAQTKIGQKATVSLSSTPGTTYVGSVYHISPAADATSKMFPVKIILDNSSRIFRDGMLAEVKMNFNEQKNALGVPIEAIIDETGTKAVFVVKNGKAIRKKVEIGISDGKMVQIISGLKLDDKIVVLGQNNLEDGSKVVVK